MILRRAFLLALVLSSCATFEPTYEWSFDPSMPLCDSMRWKVVSADRIPGLCGNEKKAAPSNSACTIGCMVISPLTAQQAMKVTEVGGETPCGGSSLYDHESCHLFGRMVHHTN